VAKIGSAFLWALAAVTAALGLASLRWPVYLDNTYFLYLAYLIERLHWVPYRDFFDLQAPGVHWIYVLAGKCSGYSASGFRAFDLVHLLALSAVTWHCARPFGRAVAWAAPLVFGAVYLSSGPAVVGQRDVFILLPLAAALLVMRLGIPAPARAFLVGCLLGTACVIRPNAIVVLPVFAPFFRRTFLRSVVPAGILGLALPAALAGAYLAMNGALKDFLDVARHYWPIYRGLAADFTPPEGTAQLVRHRLTHFWQWGPVHWIVPAAAGVLALRRSGLDPGTKRLAILPAGLVAAFLVYVALTGKFYPYHWIPFAYFAALSSALCFLALRSGGAAARVLPLLAVALSLGISLRGARLDWHDANTASAAEISGYARPLLVAETDTVQAVGSFGFAPYGALLATFDLKARPATPYILSEVLDFSRDPYVEGLRSDFLRELERSKPRFLFVSREWAVPFDAFEDWLEERYVPVRRGKDYRVYERRTAPGV